MTVHGALSDAYEVCEQERNRLDRIEDISDAEYEKLHDLGHILNLLNVALRLAS
jgi:hypothetical protein